MARVKRALNRRTRKKKLFKRAKGFFLGRRTYRQAKAAVMKAQAQEFVGRKLRKRDFRRLWIQRINAASRAHGLSYSKLMHGLKLAEIQVNRKMLADIAVREKGVFAAIVAKANEALAA